MLASRRIVDKRRVYGVATYGDVGEMSTMKRPMVSFDLTGTLATCRFSDSIWFEGLPRLYAEREGISLEEARAHLKRAYDEVGEQAVEWYDIRYWFIRFQLGSNWRSLLQDFSSNIEFYPEAKGTLARLGRRYDLILLTNASREFVEIETAEIGGYFQRIISSVSDFGEVKKTPEFYASVCDSLGRRPQEIVHVGDHWEFDFVAPRRLGIEAYYVDRTGAYSGEFIIGNLCELEAKLL